MIVNSIKPNSLADLLLQARDNKYRVAFSAETNIYWPQFINDVRSLALNLDSNLSLRIAICSEDSYLFSVAFFACVYSAKKIVLPGNHQPAMLKLLSSEFDLLINDSFIADKIKHSTTAEIKQDEFSFYKLNLNEIKLTLFTSGSTGNPKAINKTLLMLDNEIHALENQWGEQLGNAAIVSTVSHQHIYGLLFRILWPLCAGRAFASEDLIYTEQVIKNGRQNSSQAHALISSPALLKRLQYDGDNVAYSAVFSSGGPLSKEAADQCRLLLNQTPIEVFGSTETGGIGFRQQLESDSPWQFFLEVQVKLTDQSCLALLSPWLSEGNGDFYETSDQCELLSERQFRLKGRIDRIVKIEEKRISLQEIENYLNELDWISESAVLVVEDPHRVSLGALIILTELGHAELLNLGKGKFWIKLRQALRQWVEPVGIPRHFKVTDEIPMNKQGKRLQQEIAELFK